MTSCPPNGLLMASVAEAEYPAVMCLPQREGFVRWLQARECSRITITQYLDWLGRASAFCDRPADQMTEDDWIEAMEGRSPASKRMLLKAGRCYYRYLQVPDPTSRLAAPRERRAEVPYFAPEDVKVFLHALADISPAAGAVGVVLANTGARIGSMCAARVEDIDWQAGRIHWRRTKGNRPYWSPLNERCRKALTYLAETSRDGKLCPVTSNRAEGWFREASTACGLKMTPHDLRKAYGTRLVEAGVEIRVWTELMNHSSPDLWTLYSGVSEQSRYAAVAAI